MHAIPKILKKNKFRIESLIFVGNKLFCVTERKSFFNTYTITTDSFRFQSITKVIKLMNSLIILSPI